jgi:DNA-binding MarR family transcriptional regulator
MTVSRGSAHDLFLSLLRTQKLLLVSRGHLPRADADVDPTAYPVLFTLTRGPARISEIAPLVQADLSTVSRQVSALAGLGLVTKATDPVDGRAQLIALTAPGRAVAQAITDLRAAWLEDLLHTWEPHEVQDLGSLLDRLGDQLDGWLRSCGATLPPAPAEIAPSS